MITYESVESNLRMADMVLHSLVGDLSDTDLLVRATEGLLERPTARSNHIAWQLGHLIGSEYAMISQVADQVEMAIPTGWAEKYNSDRAKSDDPTHFEPLGRYLELHAAQRQATLSILKDLPPEQLEGPGPEALQMVVNTVGELFLFLAHHEVMHAGQFTCIRRKLGKPILF